MFIEAVILGLIVGSLRKGRFSNFSNLHIKGWLFVVIGALLQFVPILLGKLGIFKEYYFLFPIISTLIMIFVLFLNLDKKGSWLIILGGILNFIVIAFNGFKMPISIEGLNYSGLSGVAETILDGSIINYVDSNTVDSIWKIFGKVIAVPEIYPFAKVLSIGDVCIMIGIILFLQGEMVNNYFRRHSKIVRYSYKA